MQLTFKIIATMVVILLIMVVLLEFTAYKYGVESVKTNYREYQFNMERNAIHIYCGERFVDSLRYSDAPALEKILINDNQ